MVGGRVSNDLATPALGVPLVSLQRLELKKSSSRAERATEHICPTTEQCLVRGSTHLSARPQESALPDLGLSLLPEHRRPWISHSSQSGLRDRKVSIKKSFSNLHCQSYKSIVHIIMYST